MKRQQVVVEERKAKKAKTKSLTVFDHLAPMIPPWVASSSCYLANGISIQSNTNGRPVASSEFLGMWRGRHGHDPDTTRFFPPRSTIIDRTATRHLWIEVVSHNGRLNHSDAFLCSDWYLWNTKPERLLLGDGIHSTSRPLPLGLLSLLDHEQGAFEFDLRDACIQSALDGVISITPLQKIILEYADVTSLLVGLIHYADTDYVNIAAFGESEQEIIEYAQTTLGWIKPPNAFLRVNLSKSLVDTLPPPSIHDYQGNTTTCETIIHGL